ncbi:MAG: hypothetical protein C0403_19810 [Desulfobacterium sp.]|nr:hypothetical protein [Desulfobacterium sp.]
MPPLKILWFYRLHVYGRSIFKLQDDHWFVDGIIVFVKGDLAGYAFERFGLGHGFTGSVGFEMNLARFIASAKCMTASWDKAWG